MNAHAGRSTSLWMATAVRPIFTPLESHLQADVCIVGAGISGLTTAYCLQRAGRTVVVLDDGPILSGETERTTAHLASALDDRFSELERLHGTGAARLAAESHAAAIDFIEHVAAAERIDCDFERLDGVLFEAPDQPANLLDEELAAAQRAGHVEAELRPQLVVGEREFGRAIRFPRQAQFHPLKYLSALATCITRDDGKIFTDTHAAKIVGGPSAHVETAKGFRVTCGAVVVATNSPVNDRVTIHTKQEPYRTYVIGVAVPSGAIPPALYWDTGDPYHYVRLQRAEGGSSGEDILIVGGEDHKTGQADDAERRYTDLEAWTRTHFPMARDVRFRWSGQVMEPVDGLAFIGRNPLDHDNVFIATGDSGQGMTHGTIAGLLITDLIAGRENPWAKLYDPSRVSLKSAKEFATANANVAARYADWVTSGDVAEPREIALGSGAIVRRGLSKSAVFRDVDGSLHACSAVCPHLGGIVTWNHAEQTFDCPLHGSRFDRYGNVLNGPANRGLQRLPPPAP
ncbi:MAG TPA: FAD-dependent oxidoreductase [Candidatus Synoicihabitans sp.]|nr:FAD-dependent oxidoreductase [Candidatus Synoicihabitans sp.]